MNTKVNEGGIMPLITVKNEKQIPDQTGGWYWFREGKDEEWKPVYVQSATDSWPACLQDQFSTEVENVVGEWGPEAIPPPK